MIKRLLFGRLCSGHLLRATRWIVGLVLGFALVGCGDFAGNERFVVLDPREVIALIPQSVSPETMTSGARDNGFVLREDVILDGLGLRMLRFSFPAPLDGQGAIAVLETLEPTATAGINHVYRPAAQGNFDDLAYAQAMMDWPVQGCRARAPVGIIDTSVDAASIRAGGANLIAKDFLRGRDRTMRHGTDVASILIDERRVSGATLYSAAVVGRTASGEDVTGVDSILKGLDWLAGENVRLVNMSISGPYNKLLDEGVQQAFMGGMTIVAAVGNDGITSEPRYPAAFDTVIAVTAVDADRGIYRDAVRGTHVDIAAPGVDILVSSNRSARFVSGTSMAAPFVTARILTDRSLAGLTPLQIRQALLQTSEDIGPVGVDAVFGAGLLGAPQVCNR